MVHSKSVLALFDSRVSHCFISSRFTALHSIHFVCMDGQWEISTGNGVVTTNRICKDCTVELCNMKLEVDMIVLNTRGYGVILGMTWLSRYHPVIDRRIKKVIFRMPHQPRFQFIGERKSARREPVRLCHCRTQERDTSVE